MDRSFFSDLSSDLCFTGNSPPERAAVSARVRAVRAKRADDESDAEGRKRKKTRITFDRFLD